MPDSPFVIGIDLGTTNSAVAFAELRQGGAAGVPAVQVFPVPQVVAEGEVAADDTLPSFLYVLSPDERASGRFAVPGAGNGGTVAGRWARDQGALVPGRLVSSAKSWLCNDAVDRHAPILPWGGDPGVATRSPVEASAAYLAHVRDAWDRTVAAGAAAAARRFDAQAVTLTVPASFDDEARELTVEAARLAQFPRVALVEEPTAALYAWIGSNEGRIADHLRDADRVLVCDVGGGTTDFTLVTVRIADGEPRFERTAVGEHLLLGGDNLDLALVHLIEEKLGRPRLGLRQQLALRRQSASIKEQLLGPPPVERAPVSVLGAGRAVVGGALTTEVTREEVLRLLLDGFLPACGPDAAPSGERRTGLRELGLPFATDAAVTRHLAAFLRAAGDGAPVRPDAILFNGGFFTPTEARDRVADVVAGWFAHEEPGWRPRVLANARPATAVAEGAAYSALVRRGYGVRVGGGSARAYFVALGRGGEAAAGSADAGGTTVCILPRGTPEGTTALVAGREFAVATNRPLSFTLWSTVSGHHALGDLVAVDPERFHRHAPLVTELRFGKRSRQADVPVRLEVTFTELGILELWLAARDTDHRWRLQFQLRRPAPGDTRETAATAATAVVAPEILDRAVALVRDVFPAAGASTGTASPDTLMAQLEEAFGYGKHAWPIAAVRPLADALLAEPDARRRSPRHEARWLNLLGYCLRPGFGATLDEFRMTQARRLSLAGLAFPNDVQCQAEWLVLWQRVAGGLTAGQQQEIFDRHAALLGLGSGRKARKVAPQLEREGLRLLASLEQVTRARRAALGDDLVARLARDPRNPTLLWAIARAGAREPFNGPLNAVVDPDRTLAWIEALLRLPRSPDVVAAVVQLGARTGDPVRDLDEDAGRAIHDRLLADGAPPEALAPLIEIQERAGADVARVFGESLPEGLRLVAPGREPVQRSHPEETR